MLQEILLVLLSTLPAWADILLKACDKKARQKDKRADGDQEK